MQVNKELHSGGGHYHRVIPCRRFAACKRSLNVTWKSIFRQNYRPTFSPTVPPFAARISRVVWTWRHLAAEVGTSKPPGWSGAGVQGRTISLIGCGASGAYAPGPVEEEEEEEHSKYTRSCIHIIVLLMMSTELLETCRGFK
jgi:hypothetical protein